MAASVPSYRELAQRSLDQAAQELNGHPNGGEPPDVSVARSSRALAIASVGALQALLEIGDVLRDRPCPPS